MKKCWDSDPNKRPTALEINNVIVGWMIKIYNNDSMEFQNADEQTNVLTTSKNIKTKPITESHPQAFYTSRLLDFTKKLNEILDQNKDENFRSVFGLYNYCIK